MQHDPDFLVWLRQVTTDRQLARLRCKTIAGVAPKLEAAGFSLQNFGNAADNDETFSSLPGDESRAAAYTVGELGRIAAELAGVSGELLCGERHYAGAALLRQIVEIEYLTWAFAQEKRDAVEWLNSTSEDRRSYFRAARLRKLAGDRFKDKDYWHHCEQGGHPVPGAGGLIGGSNQAAAQILLVDLLLHCWRIADALRHWVLLPTNDSIEVPEPLKAAHRLLRAWGERDPYYQFACLIEPDSGAEAQ